MGRVIVDEWLEGSLLAGNSWVLEGLLMSVRAEEAIEVVSALGGAFDAGMVEWEFAWLVLLFGVRRRCYFATGGRLVSRKAATGSLKALSEISVRRPAISVCLDCRTPALPQQCLTAYSPDRSRPSRALISHVVM